MHCFFLFFFFFPVILQTKMGRGDTGSTSEAYKDVSGFVLLVAAVYAFFGKLEFDNILAKH